MQNLYDAPVVSVQASPLPSKSASRTELNLKAEKLLNAYQAGNASALETFRTRHPAGHSEGFSPTLLDARQVVMSMNMQGQKLSLERLRKEAKQLLKDLKANDPIALHRVASLHPKAQSGMRVLEEMSLVDIQHVLALESGFTSWPKLKHHLQAMAENARYIKSGNSLGGAETLHIRCGSDLKAALEEARIDGTFMEVINPFTMGPVLSDRLDERSLKLRTDYMTEVLGPYIEEERRTDIRKNLEEEEKALLALEDEYEEVVLWFEHDAYDQLCLAYLLHHMARKSPNLPFKLSLVQVDRFPGIKRFVGLGQISQPEGFTLLYRQRLQVTPPMISFGATMWEAFTNSDPTELWSLINEVKSPLPLMQNAFWRIIAELPSPKNGLGLTERLALDIIAKEGSLLARRAFLFAMADRDPQPYHGDIMFFAILKSLWSAEYPALEITGYLEAPGDHGKEILSLTPLGERLLRGQANWLDVNKIQKWVGGIEINTEKAQNWYYIDDKQGPKRR